MKFKANIVVFTISLILQGALTIAQSVKKCDKAGLYIDGKRVSTIKHKDFKSMEVILPYDSLLNKTPLHYLWISIYEKNNPSKKMIAGLLLLDKMIDKRKNENCLAFRIFTEQLTFVELEREIQFAGKPALSRITRDSLFKPDKAGRVPARVFSFWIEALQMKGSVPAKESGEKDKLIFDTVYISPKYRVPCLGNGKPLTK